MMLFGLAPRLTLLGLMFIVFLFALVFGGIANWMW